MLITLPSPPPHLPLPKGIFNSYSVCTRWINTCVFSNQEGIQLKFFHSAGKVQRAALCCTISGIPSPAALFLYSLHSFVSVFFFFFKQHDIHVTNMEPLWDTCKKSCWNVHNVGLMTKCPLLYIPESPQNCFCGASIICTLVYYHFTNIVPFILPFLHTKHGNVNPG